MIYGLLSDVNDTRAGCLGLRIFDPGAECRRSRLRDRNWAPASQGTCQFVRAPPQSPPVPCGAGRYAWVHRSPRDGTVCWRNPRAAYRLPGMAYLIDRADPLGYLASDARVRDPSTGTLVVRLSEAAGYRMFDIAVCK